MTESQTDNTVLIENIIRAVNSAVELTFRLESKKIEFCADEISKSMLAGGKVMWAGNGSASQTQHFSAELLGRLDKTRRPYASIALASDSSALTCIANDFGFEHVFSRQVEGLGNERLVDSFKYQWKEQKYFKCHHKSSFNEHKLSFSDKYWMHLARDRWFEK